MPLISGSVDVKPKSNSDLHSSYWPPGGDSCDGKKTKKAKNKFQSWRRLRETSSQTWSPLTCCCWLCGFWDSFYYYKILGHLKNRNEAFFREQNYSDTVTCPLIITSSFETPMTKRLIIRLQTGTKLTNGWHHDSCVHLLYHLCFLKGKAILFHPLFAGFMSPGRL